MANKVYSAVWDCIRLGRLFILMLVVRMGVFLVLIIRSRRHDGWVGWKDWGSGVGGRGSGVWGRRGRVGLDDSNHICI